VTRLVAPASPHLGHRQACGVAGCRNLARFSCDGHVKHVKRTACDLLLCTEHTAKRDGGERHLCPDHDRAERRQRELPGRRR
jgi:hypothetical protein